jgi:predicted enzyme related to lactoylglutathione lyase
MNAQTIYAAIAVADIERSIAWYSKLFGRNVDQRPMKETAEWLFTGGGGVQLVLDGKRAGKSIATVGLVDLDRTTEDVKARGIELEPLDTGSGPFLLAQVTDPDGNVLTFAQPRTMR